MQLPIGVLINIDTILFYKIEYGYKSSVTGVLWQSRIAGGWYKVLTMCRY